MKALRTLPIIMLAALVLLLPVSAVFTPSVAQKDAEFVSSEVTENGEAVVGYVVAADGTVLPGLTEENTVITSVAKIEEAPEEIRVVLEQAVEQLTETPVAELVENFAEVWEEITEGAPVENVAVAHLFDVSTDLVLDEGTTASFTVANPGIAVDTAIVVLHNYEGDKWEIVPHTRDENGNITITVGGFSPFAILADTGAAPEVAPDAPKSPGTYEEAASYMMFAAMLVLGAAALFAVSAKKAVK